MRTPDAWRIGIIVLTVVAILAVAASGLVYPSPYSPLILGGAAAAAAVLVAWFRKPVWALYAALFVVLLPIGLIPPQIHSDLNRSLTVIALAVWLFDVIARRRRIAWTSSALVMLGFLVWSLVTLFGAANMIVGTNALQVYTLRWILFMFLVANEIRTREDLDGLMNTLALAGWVLVLVSAWTIWSGGYTVGTRLQVAEENSNGLGVTALVTLPGVLWLAMRTSGWKKTVSMLLSFIFISLALVVTVLSGSRGSAISFLVCLLAFWLWKPTRSWGKLGLLILVVVAVTAPFVFSTLMERLAVERGDTFLGGREGLWQAAWLLIRDHALGGVGIGNAPYEVLSYVRLFRSVGGYERAVIHNPVLTIWAEIGIPGLILYLGILGSAVGAFVRQYRCHKKAGVQWLLPYYALVSSVFLGYMLSWIKGGGLESDFTYFLMLALLLIPSGLDVIGQAGNTRISPQSTGRSALGMKAPACYQDKPHE
jgi:O-antigen ligase